MGNCPCCPGDATDRELDRKLKANRNEEVKVKKLLLLGAGGSGKSTFFKQLRILHGAGMSPDERNNIYTNIVYSNIISGMRALLDCFDSLNDSKLLGSYSDDGELIGKQEKAITFDDDPDMVEAMNFFRNNADLDEENFNRLKTKISDFVNLIWRKDYIQQAWSLRSQFQIQDSAAHFFDDIERICQPGWKPTEKDVLLARIRTTGIVEQEFTIKKNKFQVYDVGGQRNERKKWIHCFENVTGVLFLASLSAYDQTLYEDQDQNRMIEALDLFKQICNSRWFKETAMILFLNKKDLFKEKIRQTSLTVCFPELEDDKMTATDEISARNYIKERFIALNHPVKGPNGKSRKKPLFCHFTCAIDKNQVQRIFRDVQNVIIHANLEKAALI